MLTASSLFPRCELAAIKMLAVDARVLIAVELIAAHDRSGPKSIAASTQRARSEHTCSQHFPLRASRDRLYAGGIFQFDRSMIAVKKMIAVCSQWKTCDFQFDRSMITVTKMIAALGNHCSQLDRS